jgi:HEPN domain-containing protein
MPHEPGYSGTPLEWIGRARSNLARAKQSKPAEVFWEDLCFDLQQSAEKAVKAVLVFRGIDFPKTHDIRDLLTLLDPDKSGIPEKVWSAIDLTDYAVESRYPGRADPVTEEEYHEALVLAEIVFNWAEDVITNK